MELCVDSSILQYLFIVVKKSVYCMYVYILYYL